MKFNQRSPVVVGRLERTITNRSNPNIWTPMSWNRDEREGRGQQNRQTYCWRDLADHGKQEPNEALTNMSVLVNLERHSENLNHRTCFQRMRSKLNASPAPNRRRSNPMSMMKSNKTSAISEPIILGFMLNGLSRLQEWFTGDRELRTYGSRISQAGPK